MEVLQKCSTEAKEQEDQSLENLYGTQHYPHDLLFFLVWLTFNNFICDKISGTNLLACTPAPLLTVATTCVFNISTEVHTGSTMWTQ